MGSSLLSSTRFAIGKHTYKGVWINTKTMTIKNSRKLAISHVMYTVRFFELIFGISAGKDPLPPISGDFEQSLTISLFLIENLTKIFIKK